MEIDDLLEKYILRHIEEEDPILTAFTGKHT
jgi:hypothetical protein